MKNILISMTLLLLLNTSVCCQNFITRNGNVSFFSHTPLEDIKAENNEAVSVLNSANGDIEFKVAIKSFHFAKTAMENHFNNDDYMSSEKYPKAGFKGKIENIASINFSKDGTYKVNVAGALTIKDVTQTVNTSGSITVKEGKVSAIATFTIKRKDFHVIGESFVQKRIGEEIQISVNCQYEKF